MDVTERSRLARLITWLIVGVVVVLLARVLFVLLKFSASILGFLLFTVVPLILVGWLAMKLWHRYDRRRLNPPRAE